jgi:hypothetical protein
MMAFEHSLSRIRLERELLKGGEVSERTVKALAGRAHVSVQVAAAILAVLCAQGAVHIDAWVQTGRTGQWSASYLAGLGVNAECPRKRRDKRVVNWRTAPSGQRLLAQFQTGVRSTARDLAEVCFVSPCTANSVCALMHADRVLRIVAWQRSSQGPVVPVYVFRKSTDRQKDAVRLLPMGVTERRHRRIAVLEEQFGAEAALAIKRAMYNGGKTAPVMVVAEGRVVYQRGMGVLSMPAEVRDAAV